MDTTQTGPAPPRFVATTLTRSLAWDVGLPVVTYYAFHLAGFGDFAALLAATLVAASRVLLVAVRDRALNAFGMLMVIVFGLGLALAFLSGDPRFLLVKDSITTAVVGMTFLVMAFLGQPLTLAASRTAMPRERADELAEQYRTVPEARHWHLKASTVWGIGLLTEAAVRVVLIYLLPVDVMVAVSAALMITTFAVLILWTVSDIRRQQARRASHAPPPADDAAGPSRSDDPTAARPLGEAREPGRVE